MLHVPRRAAACALSFVVILAPAAHAQSGAPVTAPPGRERGLELWAGLARHSPQLGPLGDTPNMNLALAAVRWTRRLRQGRSAALDYTVDLIPAAILSPPLPGSRSSDGAPQTPGDGCVVNQPCALTAAGHLFPPGSAFGVGASPLGLTAVFRPGRRVQPTLGATGGLIWFDRREPTTSAAHLNFTAAAEAGARLLNARGSGVTLTYRFHHISNGGTAPDNYAIASHLLSVGARWRLGRGP